MYWQVRSTDLTPPRKVGDKQPQPIFPRWFGWFNIWIVFIYLPGSFVPLFKTGPFAWNGILAWWIPLTLFVIWMITMTYLLLVAIKRQEAEYTHTIPAVGQ